MNHIIDFIESGILESYVLGLADEGDTKQVEEMAYSHEAVRKMLDTISLAFEKKALEAAVTPPALVKPFFMASIDYMTRMAGGEAASFPPLLHDGVAISDYSDWLNRQDMIVPEHFDNIFAKIIGYTPDAVTAIVWLKDRATPEVHTNEFEKFLIIEGTCNIRIGEVIYPMAPGDFLTIPLFEPHEVIVTSSFPCKVILQRVAA